MIVDSTTSTSTSSSDTTSSSSGDQSLGKEEFLTLLVASLKYQDPLSPMDNTEFVAQMAQFSTVEQLFGVNDNLESLQIINSSINNTQALNLIGKEVEAYGDSVHVADGVASDIAFTLDEEVTSATISISDSDGNIVRTIDVGYLEAGDNAIAWDAKSSNGSTLDDNLYTYYVDATNSNGESVEVTTYMRGIVESISMEDGITYAHIGDNKIMLSDISLISDADTSTDS